MANMETLKSSKNGYHNMTIGDSLLGTTRNHISPMGLLQVSPQSSLSCSPSSDNSQGFEFHEHDDESKATELARDFITYKLHGIVNKHEDEITKTLRIVGDEFISKHPVVINAIAKRLKFSETASPLSEEVYIMVANEMYEDGGENWGRIVSLFVFGAILAINDKEDTNGVNTENIIQYVGNYIEKKSSWMERNGGWGGFVKYFNRNDDKDSTVWKGIFFAACAVASIAAVAR